MTRASTILARLALALPCGACAAVASQEAAPPATQVPAPPPQEPARVDTSDGSDWIRLGSGEWLKGAIGVLDRQTLEFESDELGALKIDWGDVVEVRTAREFTVLLDDRSELRGLLRLAEGELSVWQRGAAREVERARVFRIVPGERGELDFWSGRLSLGMTARSGNTDQVDASAAASVKRRTARSRFTADYAGAYAEVQGVQSANNHRLLSQLDRFLHPRFFLTPFGIELFKDPFQNVDLRATPFAGLGYALVDESALEWDARLALGWRWTRFDSVGAGEPESESALSLQPATTVSADLTETVELELAYAAQISLEDTADTNQNASAALVVDLIFDLDLDLRLRWDRVGLPRTDQDGNVPQKDDFRLSVGLSWSF